MKRIIIPALLLGSSLSMTQAQRLPIIPSTMTNATVYYGNGAELQHKAKVPLQAGSQDIVISNLAHSIDEKTVQIACPEDVVLLSYRFNLNTETIKPEADVRIDKMRDSIKAFTKQIRAITYDESVQNDLLSRITKLIETNFYNTPEKTINATELIKLMDLYGNRIQTIKTTLFSFQTRKESLNDSINAINERMRYLESLRKVETRTNGQMILQVMSKNATNADFEISYFTRSAGWMPTYDIRVKTVDNSFKLVYKATLIQTTGIDWKQVRLNLSTGNPNQSSTAPILSTMFADVWIPQLFKDITAVKKNAYAYNSIQGRVAGVEVTTDDVREDLEEKEIGEGDLVKAYTTLSESQLNTNFEIDLPYDIPSDGKGYSVGIKDEMIKAGYRSYAVPKLDPDVFLLAEVSDWESLNLLPGDANIIMDNVYLGRSFIDPNTTADTLHISLGRDKRISVKRTIVKEFTKSRTKGDTKTDEFTYEIVVKNNKRTAVDLLLKDQYPLSRNKEVEVTLTDDGNAEVNKDLGVLNWNLKLAPGESKTYRFSYSIKYPKDKKLRYLSSRAQ